MDTSSNLSRVFDWWTVVDVGIPLFLISCSPSRFDFLPPFRLLFCSPHLPSIWIKCTASMVRGNRTRGFLPRRYVHCRHKGLEPGWAWDLVLRQMKPGLSERLSRLASHSIVLANHHLRVSITDGIVWSAARLVVPVPFTYLIQYSVQCYSSFRHERSFHSQPRTTNPGLMRSQHRMSLFSLEKYGRG